MKDHHRDALATALIGTVCGAVIGSGYMGYLEPLTAELTSGENTADWFAGLGTWAIGIVGVVVSAQLERTRRSNERIKELERASKVEENERRRQATAVELAKRRKEKEAIEWEEYQYLLTRLMMPHSLLNKSFVTSETYSPAQVHGIVRVIKACITTRTLSHVKFVKNPERASDCAMLDVLVAQTKENCESISRMESSEMFAKPLPALMEHEMKSLVRVAKKLSNKARDLVVNATHDRGETS